MFGVLQILGALLVLAPFVGLQLGRLQSSSSVYLWTNLIGASLLAALAARGAQWGFLMLEGVWALVAARSLLTRYSAR